MAPRRNSKDSAASGKASAKKPSAKKPSAKKSPSKRASAAKKPPARKRTGPAVTTPARPPRRWRTFLAIEATVVLLGVGLGLVGAGAALWSRAHDDIDAWRASPPAIQPAVVLSAPMELQVGQPLDVAAFTQDLVAAGYERVDTVSHTDQFSVKDGVLDIRTSAWSGIGSVAASEARVRIVDGYIAATRPDVVRLRPTVLARLGDLEAARDPVDLSALPEHVPQAVLAMEDARFREHGGIDPLGVVRAVWHNLRNDGAMHGGSTLTQQLAKNLFLSQERTGRRKVREAFFAAALESRLSKDEILAIYLGEVYLGHSGGVPVHGVEQAARAWFGVAGARLDLGQAATIAGVISAPNAYSPLRHPEAARQRRDLALSRMETLGWITAAQAQQARSQPLELRGVLTGPARRAPWAVDAALDHAEQVLGPGELARSAFRVQTTIQPHLQRAAERAVLDGLAQVVADHPDARDAQAALVAVRADDGAIVALVGSRDYNESPFDRAHHAWRNVGSTVKPLTLVAAFDANPALNAVSTVQDEPIARTIDGKPWTPRNYDGRYLGTMTLRAAIEQSRNVPAVKLAEEVGATELQTFLRELGLTRATNLPSAALGAFSATPVELAGAYTVLPGGGEPSLPRLVEGITDRSGQIVVASPPQTEPLASARAAAMTTRITQGVITHGTARKAQGYGVSGQVGAKTGTTDEGRDAWMAGITPGYAVVVWVGNDQGPPLGLGGGQAALPIWARFLAEGGVLGGRFPEPDGLVEATTCRISGRIARDECTETATDLFVEGHVPHGKCDVHGGPLVEAGGWLRGLFGGGKRQAVEGEGAGDTDVP